jgi:hypothetical protein
MIFGTLCSEDLMGASGWSYFTEWQRDPGVALDTLRRQEAAEIGAEDDIQALLESGESGTHTILDILGVSALDYEKRDPDEMFQAYPAPDVWLMEAYGTLRPTRKMVEEKGFDPAEQIERWTAVYFAVWDSEAAEGDPQWWYFNGCSGD